MNREQAQRVLLAYRLGETAGGDAQFAEALEMARKDPALMVWLEQEMAADRLVRERLRTVSPPLGLRDRILATNKTVTVPWWRSPTIWAAAAAVVLVLGGASWWLGSTRGNATRGRAVRQSGAAPLGQASLAAFQAEMTKFVATGGYSLDLQSDNLAEVKRFLAARNAQPDAAIPGALEKLRTYGCQIFDWNGSRVTLICFRARGIGIAHLFVVDAALFRDSPSTEKQFTAQDTWTAVSWRDGRNALVLCAPSDVAALRRFLEG